jgi:hypothetical protein
MLGTPRRVAAFHLQRFVAIIIAQEAGAAVNPGRSSAALPGSHQHMVCRPSGVPVLMNARMILAIVALAVLVYALEQLRVMACLTFAVACTTQ